MRDVAASGEARAHVRGRRTAARAGRLRGAGARPPGSLRRRTGRASSRRTRGRLRRAGPRRRRRGRARAWPWHRRTSRRRGRTAQRAAPRLRAPVRSGRRRTTRALRRSDGGGSPRARRRGRRSAPRQSAHPGPRATMRRHARRRRRRPRRGWDSRRAPRAHVTRRPRRCRRQALRPLRGTRRGTTESAVRVLERTGGFAQCRGRRARPSAHEESDPTRQTPDRPGEFGALDHRGVVRRLGVLFRLADTTAQRARRASARGRGTDRSSGTRRRHSVDRARGVRSRRGRPDRGARPRWLEHGGQDGGRRRAREILSSDGARVAAGQTSVTRRGRPRGSAPGVRIALTRSTVSRSTRSASANRPSWWLNTPASPAATEARMAPGREGPTPYAARRALPRSGSGRSALRRARMPLRSRVRRRAPPAPVVPPPPVPRTAAPPGHGAELFGMRAIAGIDPPQRDAEQLGCGPVARRFHHVGQHELRPRSVRADGHAVAEHFAEERVPRTPPADAPAVVT